MENKHNTDLVTSKLTPEFVASLLVRLEREGWLGIDVSYTAYVMPELVRQARMTHCCEHGRLDGRFCRWCGEHNDGSITPDMTQDADCFRCADERDRQRGAMSTWTNRMYVCPLCGNKRCPKATDHRFDCTDSNEPGQRGSRYAARVHHIDSSCDCYLLKPREAAECAHIDDGSSDA